MSQAVAYRNKRSSLPAKHSCVRPNDPSSDKISSLYLRGAEVNIEAVSMQDPQQHRRKKEGGSGFLLTMKVFFPLSVLSYLNESVNGSFCMWGDCAPPPFYYHFPRVIGLCVAVAFLLHAWGHRGTSDTHEGSFAWGVFAGVIIGVLMFMVLSIVGWLQES